MKIVHTADIQVKTRNDVNLTIPSYKMLSAIKQILIDTKAEVYIMAGDLFEYAEPTDAERVLINRHIAEVHSIPTLKEIVILAGNHDLIKEKKQNESSIGNNPISTITNIINNLTEVSNKIIYIDKTDIYPSKLTNKFAYLGYSLEDNFADNQGPLFDEIKVLPSLTFSVYHAMIKEFVIDKKVPLRKDVLNSLHDMSIFPENTLVTAGDIHMNLLYNGEKGQKFIYPGSPMQHTHKEGSYYSLNDKGIVIERAEQKSVKIYEFQDSIENPTIDDVSISEIPLDDYVIYSTISLNHKFSVEENIKLIEESIKDISDKLSINPYFILKIKTQNTLLKSEKVFFDFVLSILNKIDFRGESDISFDYDKKALNQIEAVVNNAAVKEILEEKRKEIIDEIKAENPDVEIDYEQLISINSDNIDDLILSNSQIIKLFNSILDSKLKSIKDVDITNKELSTDIINLFTRELENVVSASTRYNIVLNYAETNGFMKLQENKIQLDIVGLARILGTNGIGKTTLFLLIRWILTGEIYEGMSKSKAMQNTLPIFNKNKIDEDFVIGKLSSNINNIEVLVTRTAERKWKNNTTDEMKASLNWTDYISTVSRDIKVELFYPDGTVKTLSGENAEKYISTWFGETINNILFINQTKIENILRMAPDKLNELILNFIGVDYIAKMENNLDSVKAELMTITKPTKSKEDLQLAITDDKIFIKNKEKQIEENSNDIKRIELEIDENQKQQSILNEKLLSLGNVVENYGLKSKELAEVIKHIEIFEEIPIKDKIVLEVEAPVKDIKTEEELKEKIKINLENISTVESKLLDKNEEITLLTTKLIDIKNKNVLHNEKLLEEQKTEFKKSDENIALVYDEFKVIVDKLLIQLNDKKETQREKINEISNNIKNNNEKIESNNLSVINGVCDKCNSVLIDNLEEHKKHVEEENQKLTESILTFKNELIEANNLFTKINNLITAFEAHKAQILSKDLQIVNVEHFKNKNPELISKLMEAYAVKEGFSVKIQTLTETLKKWYSFDTNVSTNILYEQIFTDTEDLYNIVEKIKSIRNDIREVNELKKKYDKENSDLNESLNLFIENFSKAVEDYNKLLTDLNEKNRLIELSNEKAKKHNDTLLLKQSDKIRLESEIEILQKIKLPEYQELYDKYKVGEDTYNDLMFNNKTLLENNTKYKVELERLNNNLILSENKYEDYLKYQKNNMIWSIYSKLIKDNFKEIVFEYYRTFLNSTLNSLLEDVSFKLFWNNDSELYMIEYNQGITTYQPVRQSSGMETCFLGLSLIYTIHLLNVKNTISHIFIDEISGTLNKGKELTYKAPNYQELLVAILSKFTEKSVFIIDHNIDNLSETTTYEVVPTEKGSKYIVR